MKKSKLFNLPEMAKKLVEKIIVVENEKNSKLFESARNDETILDGFRYPPHYPK